ncbi:CBS domain-containing protein [Salirhabdus salicampi]|uniref:CBS domain-containing protein n=1 Tax=Salirhabdus salicampi TaxID=476102 RepID=UPI0020C4382B|nr:CBS domain-containing protein [Salirhabdus salicampi]MCP8616634.1 CBS domain-containing protein [Salirhabdus salicampi]
MKSVRDIMTTDVDVCTTEDNIYEAAVIMKNRDVGAVPICDREAHLIGMVTDRDLVIRGYADKKSGSTSIQEVMSDQLYSVSPDTTTQEATEIMAEKKIRRLPVVDNGKLVGIVSLGDLSLDEQSDEAAGEALEEISETRPGMH